MKKIVLTLIVSFLALVGFSQKKNIQNAYNSFNKEDRDGVKTNLSEAKYFIDLAYNNDESSNHPKMWKYRGQIYQEIFQKKLDLDYDAVFKSTEAFVRCLDRDKKGRLISRKIMTEEQVYDGLIQCGSNLFTTAGSDFSNQEYELSIKKYDLFLDILVLDKNEIFKRQNITQYDIYYNMAITARMMGDSDNQISYLTKLIDLNTNNPRIYVEISSIYSNKGDLEKALEYIKLGQENLSSEIELINAEIDLLRMMGKLPEEIIQKLTDAIEIDNSNEILFIIRSQQYSLISEIVKAEEDLLEALEINSESASANNNLASLYLSLTEPLVKKRNDLSYRETKKIDDFDKEIEQLQRKSLPFLIKYLSIKEDNGEVDKAALNTLASIYYNLNMEKESTETRNKLNSEIYLKYIQIKIGMTKTEVEEILGNGNSVEETSEKEIIEWKDGSKTISITFNDNKVYLKVKSF